MKKEKLYNDSCRIHFKVAPEWGNAWHTTVDSIHEYINQELELLHHENICYGRTVTITTTRNCATGGYRSELPYTHSPCFMTMCNYRSVCFNAACQFTPLLHWPPFATCALGFRLSCDSHKIECSHLNADDTECTICDSMLEVPF
jgi:hypothetical protein